MNRRTLAITLVITASASLIGLVGPARADVGSSAAKPTSAKITARISGAPAGSKILAVTSNGSSSYARISGGKFTVTLPKLRGTTATFSLHLVNSRQSYAGSISFGKVTGKSTKWYGRLTVKNGRTTSLPKISFSSTYGSVKLTGSSAKLLATSALRGSSKTGRPAGAGNYGLAKSRKASSKGVHTASVSSTATTATGPGDDLDGDGIPNSLDIDDDGDGYPDPVDQSAGANGSAPTAKYDAFSSLGSGIDNGPNRMTSPINYNFLRARFPTASDIANLMKELSYLADANFSMVIRAVSPFFTQTMGTYIKAAWVDCTGLAWCLTDDDQSDPANFVSAPRILGSGDGSAPEIWKYAFTKTPGTPCDIHAMNSCNSVRWSTFTMKGTLEKAIANGSTLVTPDDLKSVADQPTTGFGLFDAYVLNGPPTANSKGNNSAGFDLSAYINPRGYGRFLDNLKPGDVFTINALLSDGTRSSIAMTVAPYFVTAPAITTFTPAGAAAIPVDYNSDDTKCANHQGNEDCRLGSEQKPISISSGNPVLDLSFWRPQRLRLTGADDAITGGEPLVDMGGLDYRLSVQGGDGSPFIDCPNSAVTFSSSDGGTWSEVPKPTNAMSNDHEYMKDGSADATASATRTVSVRIDFSKCPGLSTSASDQKYGVRLEADSQPTFGGQRGSTSQTFYLKFQ